MTDLQHLQKIILMMIKDIDVICRKHHIKYYLLGGSCIGAIRHKGFIPWDDDLDIMMTRDNYEKFIEACKQSLDPTKYSIQEALKDWPLNFTKIRLKGTILHEPEDEYASENSHGIYVDIFILENTPNNSFLNRIHYFIAKYYLCFLLGKRHYKSASFSKKLMIGLAYPMRIKFIRKTILGLLNYMQKNPSGRYAFFYGRTRYKNSFVDSEVLGNPTYTPFEDTELPVPEKYHKYLTMMFGDYMKLPPEEDRQGLHMLSVDFGKY